MMATMKQISATFDKNNSVEFVSRRFIASSMRFTGLRVRKIDGGKLNSARSVGPNVGAGISLVLPAKFCCDLASATVQPIPVAVNHGHRIMGS